MKVVIVRSFKDDHPVFPCDQNETTLRLLQELISRSFPSTGTIFECSPVPSEESVKALESTTLLELGILRKVKARAERASNQLNQRAKEDTLLLLWEEVFQYEKQVRGKPNSEEEAKLFLKSYLTAKSPVTIERNIFVAVINPSNGVSVDGFATSVMELQARELETRDVDHLIDQLTLDRSLFSFHGAFSREALEPYVL